jgi:hypothetical protein
MSALGANVELDAAAHALGRELTVCDAFYEVGSFTVVDVLQDFYPVHERVPESFEDTAYTFLGVFVDVVPKDVALFVGLVVMLDALVFKNPSVPVVTTTTARRRYADLVRFFGKAVAITVQAIVFVTSESDDQYDGAAGYGLNGSDIRQGWAGGGFF